MNINAFNKVLESIPKKYKLKEKRYEDISKRKRNYQNILQCQVYQHLQVVHEDMHLPVKPSCTNHDSTF